MPVHSSLWPTLLDQAGVQPPVLPDLTPHTIPHGLCHGCSVGTFYGAAGAGGPHVLYGIMDMWGSLGSGLCLSPRWQLPLDPGWGGMLSLTLSSQFYWQWHPCPHLDF